MRVSKSAQVGVTAVIVVTASMPSKSYVGQSVTLTASWDSGVGGPFRGSITWGDGTSTSISQTSKSLSATHTYTAKGTFNWKVAVDDEYTAGHGEATGSITIADAVTASISASPASGTPPLAVTFTLGAGGGFPSYNWTLDPGDGSAPYPGTRAAAGSWTQSHTYTKSGAFTAVLTVEDSLGTGMYAQITIGSGVRIWLPTLRKLFPNVFKYIDQVRAKIPARPAP